MTQRSIMIGPDGSVIIPMGGSFQAAGRTISQLRDAVVDRLKTVSFPASTDAQGATAWTVVYPESVPIEIAEYRPVSIAGDVLTPGSQPFRAGLTVVQAVSVAGGASAHRARQDHSINRAGTDVGPDTVLEPGDLVEVWLEDPAPHPHRCLPGRTSPAPRSGIPSSEVAERRSGEPGVPVPVPAPR